MRSNPCKAPGLVLGIWSLTLNVNYYYFQFRNSQTCTEKISLEHTLLDGKWGLASIIVIFLPSVTFSIKMVSLGENFIFL